MAPAPSYDITTIKPNKSGDNSVTWRWRSNTYEATNSRLQDLIASVYSVRSWLIFGLPPWAQSARYDIYAKISEGDPTVLEELTLEQRRQMIAGILKDRFGLQSHLATKEQPVYELSVLPDGPRFRHNVPPPVHAEGDPPANPQKHWSIRNGELSAIDVPMALVVENLSYHFERMVIDKTGLVGNYDLKMRWTPEENLGKPGDNGTGDQAPDIFTAIREQLGLKLTPAKAPVPIVIVDHIDPPQEN
jgi:uncharacterized protein (TIGR03435 family)